MHYRSPISMHQTYTQVSNSRFVCTINRVQAPAEARQFLSLLRVKMPDASHHVYSFRIGYGNSVIEGMSDDGEPTGTAGAPILTVIRRTGIGDILIVVTRYFGGTKLGRGGLVRAYTEAAKLGINTLLTEINIPRKSVGIEVPYPFYERLKRLAQQYDGKIVDETFDTKISVIISMPIDTLNQFQEQLTESSGEQIETIQLD